MNIKRNDGFIATSLIYTFFLVFVAVLALLLNTFISSKTTLDRFNDDIISSLDSSTYTLTVISTNANIQGGTTLTNLVSNGSFSNNCAFWQINGSGYACNQIYSGFSSINKNNFVNVNQNVHLKANNQYYYSLKYASNSNSNPKTYINNINNGYIESKNTYGTWKKDSQLFSINETGNKTFHLGVGSTNDYVRYADVLLIDLTSSFNSGHEPDKRWLDENIDYFNGTISFIKKDNIKTSDTIKILMSTFGRYNNPVLNCISSNNTFAKNIATETNYGGIYKTLTLSSIKADVKCNIEWRE